MRQALLVSVIVLAIQPAHSACEMHLAYTDQASLPYQTGVGATIPGKPGIAVELVREAVQKAGCTLKLSRAPGKRVLAEVSAGVVDGAIMFSYDEERAKLLTYPLANGRPDPQRRLASLSHYLYRRRGSTVEWDGVRINGLGQRAIGVNLGFSVGKVLAAQGYAVEEVATTQLNLRKLREGRIEAYAMQDTIADDAIRASNFTDIEKLPRPLYTKDYYLVFSRRYAGLAEENVTRVWQALSELRAKRTKELAATYLEH